MDKITDKIICGCDGTGRHSGLDCMGKSHTRWVAQLETIEKVESLNGERFKMPTPC